MRALAEYVMRDRKQAVVAALLFALLPLCGWLSLSVIGLVTLRKGPIEGIFVLVWAALPATVVAILGKSAPLINDVALGSLTVWGLALALRLTNSWSAALQLVTLYIASIILIVLTVYPTLPNWWEQHFNQLLSKLNVAAWDLGVPKSVLKLMMHEAAEIATGIYGMFVLTGSIISLLFARWMQALLYNPGGLKKELYQIRLNKIASLVLLMVIIGLINGSLIAINTAFVIAVLFVAAGTSLFYRLTLLTARQAFWLIGFYVGLILFFPYTAPLLILAAVVDSGIDINRQMQLRKGNSSH